MHFNIQSLQKKSRFWPIKRGEGPWPGLIMAILCFFLYNRKIQADRWPAQIEAIAENRFAPQFVHNLHSQCCSTSKIEPLFKIPENLLVLLDNIAPLLNLEKVVGHVESHDADHRWQVCNNWTKKTFSLVLSNVVWLSLVWIGHKLSEYILFWGFLISWCMGSSVGCC